MTKPKPKVVGVDFEAYLAAEKAESKKGVDAVVLVPNFVYDDDGDVVLSDDQSDLLSLRLAPKLGAPALSVLSQRRGRVTSLSVLPLFETLLHPADVDRWRARVDDPSTPVHAAWIGKAVSGMLSQYGIDTEDEPGKSGS